MDLNFRTTDSIRAVNQLIDRLLLLNPSDKQLPASSVVMSTARLPVFVVILRTELMAI